MRRANLKESILTPGEIAKYCVYSKLDLQSVYHQVTIRPRDKAYMAFKAGNWMYQFCRILFGVTNMASFQRIIYEIISKGKLEGTFTYIDNATICAHDRNNNQFMATVEKYNLMLNYDKCFFRQNRIKLLGYVVGKGVMKLDPECLNPFLNLMIPHNLPILQWAVHTLSTRDTFILS